MTRRFPSQVYPLLDDLFDWLFRSFIFITIFLPSGSIYGFNLKSPLYLALIPLAGYSEFRSGYPTRERLALFVSIPLVLSVWIVVGLINGVAVAGALRQYTDIMMVVFLCWLIQVFCRGDDSRRVRFLRLVLNAETATSLLKLGLVFYAAFRGIPTVELVADLSAVFGVNLMTMDLGAMFGRVQFISDAIIPACVFIILRHRERLQMGNLRAAFTILLLLTSAVLSFSRYVWAYTAVAFVIGLFVGRRGRFQLIVSGVLLFSAFVSLPYLTNLYQLRFSPDVAGNSDQIRSRQTSALEEFFEDAPIFGHGLGSYTNEEVRVQDKDGATRYSYEAQLLALAGQIGITGLTFLTLVAMYYYSDLWWRSCSPLKDRAALFILLGLWIAAGFYNPLLFHPIAGVNYAIFASLAGLAKTVNVNSAAERRLVSV